MIENEGRSQDGDDVLTGGNNTGSGSVSNTLLGDSNSDSSSFSTLEGNDRLIAELTPPDQMWGDWVLGGGTGGSDTFVFVDAFSNDFVYDFHQAEGDLVEFQVAGVDSFDDITIVQSGSNTVITTSASAIDSVTLVGYDNTMHTLTSLDFIFV